MEKRADKFGFWFWLGWILWFAGSFILAAWGWTLVMTKIFGAIEGRELAVTWGIAVFGSWFILLIPFMRKKEQIWKRLNQDQESAVDAWLSALGLFVGLFVAAAIFWSVRLKSSILADVSDGLDPLWLTAVLASWLVLLIPFLIVMYRRADALFKTAAARQAGAVPQIRKIFVERSKRVLPAGIKERIERFPPTLPKGHVVTLTLKDGRRIPHVFVVNSAEILGLYDCPDMGFEAREILDVEPVPGDSLPAYEEAKWLRLDG